MNSGFIHNSENDLISIIVPVYNNEKYVGRCLESLRRQSYKNIEIICIDDGSIDDSLRKCKEIEDKDCRIKVFHTENGGAGSARNIGIKASKGKYICFCDSDDYVLEHWIEVLYGLMKQGVDLGMCSYGRSEREVPSDNDEVRALEYEKKEFWNLFKKNLLSPVFNKMFRAEIVHGSGIIFCKDRSGEDLKFNLQYISCMKGRFAYAETIQYIYIDNPLSIMHKYIPKMWVNGIERMAFLEKLLVQLEIFNKDVKDEYNLLYLDMVERCLYNASLNTDGMKQALTDSCTIIKSKECRDLLKCTEFGKKSKVMRVITITGASELSGILVSIFYYLQKRRTGRKNVKQDNR